MIRPAVVALSLGIALVLVAQPGRGEAAPAPEAAPPAASAATPDAATPANPTSKSVRVGELRRNMEGDLAEIGKIAQKVRRDGDLVKIACVADKQDRAESVMDVATPEIAVIQSESADGSSQVFAGEKLQAAAERLGKLVDEARACTGSPAALGNTGAQNQVTNNNTVPVEDPTASPGGGPGSQPPIDPNRPPIGSPTR